ncbi:hypothetical protein EMCRGX_G006471 [Ephydatia muelleri]
MHRKSTTDNVTAFKVHTMSYVYGVELPCTVADIVNKLYADLYLNNVEPYGHRGRGLQKGVVAGDQSRHVPEENLVVPPTRAQKTGGGGV